jgi:hypothetical protein
VAVACVCVWFVCFLTLLRTKAENVLLRKDGVAVLIDFGFAAFVEEGVLAKVLVGTAEYQSPEIVKVELFSRWLSYLTQMLFEFAHVSFETMRMKNGCVGVFCLFC